MNKTVRILQVLMGGLVLCGWVFSAQAAPDTDLTRHPQGLDRVGIYDLRALDPSLTGQGVRFSIVSRSFTYSDDGVPAKDFRPHLEHRCFQAGTFSLHGNDPQEPGISPHSTAVCSVLFGQDPNAFTDSLGSFIYEGIVPEAEAEVWEFVDFMTQGILVGQDLNTDVVTLSCGTGEEFWWTRGLEKLVDQNGLLVVASIGNGSEADHPLLYPGAAANLIGVGVVDAVQSQDPLTSAAYFGLVYPEHSSCGPASDGRSKPDLVAPGYYLVASPNDPNAYDWTASGSSFAAPAVAGLIGQLVQKAKQTPGLEVAVAPESGGCVIKAILMNSATKLPYWHKGQVSKEDDQRMPLDFAQGAGMVNAISAYEHLSAGQQPPGSVDTLGWDLNAVDREGDVARAYRFEIEEPNDQLITCTLVWNRHYEDIHDLNSVTSADLRLELWGRVPGAPERDTLLDISDSRVDNVEHIYSRAYPEFRDYEIVVILNESTEAEVATERFALAWNVAADLQETSILWYDLNCDGIVDALDIEVLSSYRKSQSLSPTHYAIGDINTDGVIDQVDEQIIGQQSQRQAEWYTP